MKYLEKYGQIIYLRKPFILLDLSLKWKSFEMFHSSAI